MSKLTPLSAVRRRCVDCQETTTEVKNCEFTDCPLHSFRMGTGRVKVKDIRDYCLWCMNGQANEVLLCPSGDCPLWPYRLGKNPAMKGRKGNPEALKKWKENKHLEAE